MEDEGLGLEERALEAIGRLRESLEREESERARIALQRLLNARVSRWHFDMLNDARRNEAYDRAIRRAVRPGDVVLDLGCGSGLLSLMALRAGARLVYAVEEEASLCGAAERAAAAHGAGGRVRVLRGASEALRVGPGLDLEAPADVVVSEVFDSALVGEGALGSLGDAARRLLRPGGTLVPRSAALHAAPVESPTLRRRSRPLGPVCGLDLSPLGPREAGEPEFEPLRGSSHALLGPPARALLRFDFASAGDGPREASAELRADRDGLCDAIAY